jgi:hypothetical protein
MACVAHAMKSIEFYDLPRPIQERFVAASQATLAPAPLAVKLGSRFVGVRWFVASAAVLMVTAGFALQGFGDLDHPEALASGRRALLYALGFTLSFACLTRGLTLRDRALSLPFARATYLFPAGVVDAMSSRLSVHSLSELRDVDASPHALSVTFIDGTTFQFPAQSQEQADVAKRAVSEARQRLDDATRADSVRSLAALDPLCQTNFPSPFSQDVPFKRPTPLWGVALTAMAMLSGAALGVGVWEVRNKLSARRIAEAARAQDTTQAYRRYLERGGQHPDIVDVLLPRAELAEAKAAGSVEALERYIEAHPNSKIQAEVDDALRAALLAALSKAKSDGTLAALERFAVEHPRHAPVATELADARHGVYLAAAARAKALLVPGEVQNQSPSAFIDRLVAYAEQHGPKALIVFRSYLGSSYETADNFVRASAFFGGNGTLPSRFVGGELMRKREALIAPILVSGLQSLFAPEIVRFELGEPLPSPEPGERPEPLPAPETPTLYIDYRTELSGAQLNLRPRGIFFGAGMFFETSFVLPAQKQPLQIVVPTWRSPSRNVMQHKTRTMGDVYEDLVRRSFGMFLRRYFERLMRNPPEVSVPDVELPPEEPTGG